MATKLRKGIIKLIDVTELKIGLQVIQSNKEFTKIGKLGDHLPVTNCWTIYYFDGSKSDVVLKEDQTKQFVVEFDEPAPESIINNVIKKVILLRGSDWQYALSNKLAETQKTVSFTVRTVETKNIIDFAGSEGYPVYENIDEAVLISPSWEKVAEKLYVGSKPEDNDIDWVIEEMSKKFYPPIPLE